MEQKRIDEDISILGKVSVNFQKLSTRIFEIYQKENEIERQKGIAHLGLISQAFSGINHTRYEYLILQCVISELADNTFKGTSSAQGNIRINGTEYSGNDVIKSWFLLSNFGHCKNTIGDEKALLLKAINRKGLRSYLLNNIRDKELRDWASRTIDSFDYVNFHHIISIRRVYKCLKRKLAVQNEILTIYKLLLLDSSEMSVTANQLKVEQLKMIHKNIRDLAIISLDSRNSSLPITFDILSTVLSFDFYENRFQQTQASELFHPALSLLIDSLYLHPESQKFQRSYEIDAVQNINTTDYSEHIETAIQEGLADPKVCNLRHFLRTTTDLKLNRLKENLRLALTIKRGTNNVEASLDYNPISSIQIMDFFVHRTDFELSHFPGFLTNILGILNDYMKQTVKDLAEEKQSVLQSFDKGLETLELDEQQREQVLKPVNESIFNEAWDLIQNKNVPSYKEILWAVLNYHFKENFYFDIDHHLAKEYKYFGVKLSDGMDFLTTDVKEAIRKSRDEDRKHELMQLLKSVKRRFDGIVIACLARITIYDYSKPPSKRIVTDLDSVVLKFNSHTMILEMHESKNTANAVNDARSDLKDKFVQVLNSNCKGYTIANVTGYGAKVVVKHDT